MMHSWQQLKTKIENIRDHFRPSIYRKIGGRKKISQVVDRFYQIMQTDPMARECLHTHPTPDNLKIPAEKLKDFLSGWLGGPQLFAQKYGHPRMRMRHMKFPISMMARDQWLYCMNKSLEENNISEDLRNQIMHALDDLSGVIQNRP
jgi:hemoglobin